ncbi:type I-E CRISPR-associated protein Cas5/CasD [Chordicoccus furentiruminis]|jgi:CRISPR system Cascade subunit CasD|uniref:type I-E CRISPR-associated protein Cas5/CasD n=1 Tax=Chordicoccus furentiruminis TaxID=2709410 RepID=UPI0023A8DFC9|nr:type I-E CRISPR-associated protein Cas5/CasD [Chordicoccus furentiruminis]
MSTLLMRLAAPLQSWGDDSKFNTRRTLSIPTRSGVLGMLASALGRRRDESCEDFRNVIMGVRVDQPGVLLRDFHMVHGEKQADVTERYYMSDAVYLVGLYSEDTLQLAAFDKALCHPVFPLYLGRRSCPPSFPVSLGLREEPLLEALRNEKWQIPAWRQVHSNPNLRIVVEGTPDRGLEYHRLKDDPVSFSPVHREYRYRYAVEQGSVHMDGSEETDHDAFRELDEVNKNVYDKGET